jgi:hypothetical protein
MWALGELLVLIIYIVLALPPLIMLLLTIHRWNSNHSVRKTNVIWLIALSLPFLIFVISNVHKHRQHTLRYVGTYYLSSYPNCDGCKLELNRNMRYRVFNDIKTFESGKWHFESGGDYTITYIGKSEQLGSGIFLYYKSDHN